MLCSINSVICVFLTLMSIQGTLSASLEAESSSEVVTIELYRMEQSTWSSKESAFQTELATQANTYCSTSPASCGLVEWLPGAVFLNTSVVVTTESDLKDLRVNFYITFPVGANVSTASSTQFVVNDVAVMAMITNIRVDIEHIVGAYVTYINEEYYGIPPDNVANQVIIPIAFVVLIAVIVLAIGLHFWNKRKSRRHHKKHEINSSKVTPSHTNQGAMGKNVDTHHHLKGSNVNNTTEESHQLQTVHVPPSNVSPTKRSNNEFTEVDETRTQIPLSRHLPSLPSEDAEGGQKRDRKHKKKKKKKHRRQQSEETGNGQSDAENDRKQSKGQHNRAFNEDNLYDSDHY